MGGVGWSFDSVQSLSSTCCRDTIRRTPGIHCKCPKTDICRASAELLGRGLLEGDKFWCPAVRGTHGAGMSASDTKLQVLNT
eukprot:694592-Amphidinium_carterae.4